MLTSTAFDFSSGPPPLDEDDDDGGFGDFGAAPPIGDDNDNTAASTFETVHRFTPPPLEQGKTANDGSSKEEEARRIEPGKCFNPLA